MRGWSASSAWKLASAALLTLVIMSAAACGDDGLEVRPEGEMIIRAGGNLPALNVTFPPVGRASNADGAPAIEIENGGTAPYNITAIDTVLDETGYITVKNSIDLPYEITPEGQVRIVLRLAIPSDLNAPPLQCPPAPAGLPEGVQPDLYCGEITFSSNARQGTSVQKVYLQTSQRGGSIVISPNVLTYPAPQIGREQVQSFTITNSGNGPLEIKNIIKSDFPSGTDTLFNINGFQPPQVLDANGSIVYEVSFTPETVEEIEGKIIVESDDASQPTSTVTVRTGGGDLPMIALDPEALNFTAGSETKNFTITNNGTGAALVLNRFTVTPDAASDSYTVGVVEDETCTPITQGSTQTVPRQNSKVFCVTYDADAGGLSSGAVEILSNAGNVPGGVASLTLGAGDVFPAGVITPGNIIFDAEPGESLTREFSISNEGQADLEITGFELQGTLNADEITLSPDPAGINIAVGELQSFTITYARLDGDVGVDQGAIAFISNNPAELSVAVRNNIQADAFAPVANITQTPDNPVTVGTEITLDGSGSTSMSGDISFYTWSLLTRPATSAAELPNVAAESDNIAFTPDVAGTYRVQLTVTSDVPLEGAAVREITVTE